MTAIPHHEAKTHSFERSIRKSGPAVGGTRDKIIGILKWALPAASLLLFATLVSLPFLKRREVSFLLSRDSIEKTPEVLRMEQPSYRGLDAQGRPFIITAERAVQKSSDDATVELQKLSASMITSAGEAKLLADTGAFDLKKEQLRISGGISVTRADGYRFQSSEAVLDLPSRTAWGATGVTGVSPLGTFQARKFRVDVESGSVTFDGGTKLHIVPKR